jgi:hypothetical protein
LDSIHWKRRFPGNAVLELFAVFLETFFWSFMLLPWKRVSGVSWYFPGNAILNFFAVSLETRF